MRKGLRGIRNGRGGGERRELVGGIEDDVLRKVRCSALPGVCDIGLGADTSRQHGKGSLYPSKLVLQPLY